MKRRKTILIVDDSPLIREILKNTLQSEYNLLEAADGLQAIKLLDQYSTIISLILLDLIMPSINGFQVLEFINRSYLNNKIPVIVITAETFERDIELAYDLGADEVINKPFNENIAKKRIDNIISLYTQKNLLAEIVSQQQQELKEQAVKLKSHNDILINMLSTVIEYRDLESGQHIHRIRGFTRILLKTIACTYSEYNVTESMIDMISSASAMHDVGKIAIPDSILLKPGRLTKDEFEIMKSHTTKGAELLSNMRGFDDKEYLSYCYEICMYHHERWDGAGYPNALKGNEIPLSALVVSIVDAYDALTHKRVYKDAYSLEQAENMIFSGQCGVFSPFIIKCFKDSLPEIEKLSLSCSDDESVLN